MPRIRGPPISASHPAKDRRPAPRAAGAVGRPERGFEHTWPVPVPTNRAADTGGAQRGDRGGISGRTGAGRDMAYTLGSAPFIVRKRTHRDQKPREGSLRAWAPSWPPLWLRITPSRLRRRTRRNSEARGGWELEYGGVRTPSSVAGAHRPPRHPLSTLADLRRDPRAASLSSLLGGSSSRTLPLSIRPMERNGAPSHPQSRWWMLD